MKTYTESELQELLEKQKRLCAEYLEDSFTEHPFKLDQMVNYAPSPLLPTEEVVTKEDDYVPSDNNTNQASLASHSCTFNNFIQQGKNKSL